MSQTRREWLGTMAALSAGAVARSFVPAGLRMQQPQDRVAAKPLTDLDGDWGSGRYKGDDFVKIVYLTL